MKKEKSILKFSLLLVVITVGVVFLAISLSFADDQLTTDISSDVPKAPEVSVLAEEEPQNQEVIEQNNISSSEDTQVLQQVNGPTVNIYRPDGITPARLDWDYNYNDKVINILSDSLIIEGIQGVLSNDVILVNEPYQRVHNLTLRNVYLSNDNNTAGIKIIEYKQNASFYLNIEGTCSYNATSNNQNFIQYVNGNTLEAPSFNNLYIKGSLNSLLRANLPSQNPFYGVNFAAGMSTATHFCGNLNIDITRGPFQRPCINASKGSKTDRCDLYFEDNVNISASTRSHFVQTEGNVFIKDNAIIRSSCAGSFGSGIYADPYDYDDSNYSKISIEGNASAYFESAGQDEAACLYNVDLVVNTSGVFSCINEGYIALGLYLDDLDDAPCKLEVERGTLYLSSLRERTADDNGYGSLCTMKQNVVLKEGVFVVGSPKTKANDQESIYVPFLSPVEGDIENSYSYYINTGANAIVPAGTVIISDSIKPPVSEPTETAQTGDVASPFVALCIIAIAASGGYVLSRRFRKN